MSVLSSQCFENASLSRTWTPNWRGPEKMQGNQTGGYHGLLLQHSCPWLLLDLTVISCRVSCALAVRQWLG